MNKKSRTIKIFNTKYKLLFVDKIEAAKKDDYAFGVTNSAKGTIKIATKGADGKPIDNDTMEQILIHELLHAILNEGQYLAYSDDEPLVEWLSRCLKHLINQGVIGKG